MICSDVREAVLALPDISDLELEIVWSPPWSKDRISDRGRRVLRIYGVVN
jgi:metal-sulfur cluster biosynthetic enzyme